MSEHPSPQQLAAMMQAAQREGQQAISVSAPLNDVQLQCLMASYLLGAPISYYRDMSKEHLALEVFEITAQVTAYAADPNTPTLRDRITQIINERNREQEAEGKPGLVLLN